VECFAKYDHFNEAVRHFRALVKYPGSTIFLYNEGHGRDTDPLSLYLRGLCLEGTNFSIEFESLSIEPLSYLGFKSTGILLVLLYLSSVVC